MNLVGLADCNSFFASCERIFRPDLRNRPIVVLSNNDGCIVALSKEAKALGITRGVPYFQVKDLIYREGIAVFSSNYTLYQDISDRIFSLLSQLTCSAEKYSIDESFFSEGDIPASGASQLASNLAKYLYQGVGVPVSVGMARTKTLAKIANHIAKKENFSFVIKPEDEEEILRKTPVEDVWGIGWRSAPKAKKLGIETAWDFAKCSDDFLLKYFTVCGYNTARELRGIQTLKKPEPAHLCTSSSISFAKPVNTLPMLETALACHCTTVCSKLFADDCEASAFAVQLITNKWDNSHVNEFASIETKRPTGYLPEILRLLTPAMRKIFKPNLNYKAMRVLAWNITQRKNLQGNLFDDAQTISRIEKQRALSNIVFSENSRLCSTATQFMKKRNLANSKLLSPLYTTRWDSIPRCM